MVADCSEEWRVCAVVVAGREGLASFRLRRTDWDVRDTSDCFRRSRVGEDGSLGAGPCVLEGDMYSARMSSSIEESE